MNNFPAASKFAGKLFQQGISDSHSLLEFSENRPLLGHFRNFFVFSGPNLGWAILHFFRILFSDFWDSGVFGLCTRSASTQT